MERTLLSMSAQHNCIFEINKQAAQLFSQWLYAPEGEAGLNYLRQRGLSQTTLTAFGVGFAPSRWDTLIKELNGQGYTKQEIIHAGLAAKSETGRIYDRFRNRVIFPIVDVSGNVVGFGGRTIDNTAPKYLNTPNTPVYNKSRSLFALNIAKATGETVILTEGYLDTISLHQAGFIETVATLGTAFTPEHARILSQYFSEAVLAYDGDQAGAAATLRAIPLLEKTGLKTRVLRLPEAKDPDEFIKNYGRDAFAQLLQESKTAMDYRLAQVVKKYDLQNDAQRVEFSKEAAQMIAMLPSAVEREIYGSRAAKIARVSQEAMLWEIGARTMEVV